MISGSWPYSCHRMPVPAFHHSFFFQAWAVLRQAVIAVNMNRLLYKHRYTNQLCFIPLVSGSGIWLVSGGGWKWDEELLPRQRLCVHYMSSHEWVIEGEEEDVAKKKEERGWTYFASDSYVIYALDWAFVKGCSSAWPIEVDHEGRGKCMSTTQKDSITAVKISGKTLPRSGGAGGFMKRLPFLQSRTDNGEREGGGIQGMGAVMN